MQQLLVRTGSVSVGANDSHPEASLGEESCQFYRAGCLASSLDTDQHDLPERARLDLDFGRVLTDKLGHFLVEHFDNVLSTIDSRRKILLDGAFFYSFGELEN